MSNPSVPVVPVQGADAVVSIGDLSGDFNFTAQYRDGSDQQDLAIDVDFVIKNHYEGDNHLYMMPIASPNGFGSQGDTVAFCQLASPTLLWISDWSACKFLVQPKVPDPYSVGSNWILLDVHLQPDNIQTALDMTTPAYRISGTYVFGCRRPSAKIFNDIRFGRPPWLQDTFTRTMPLDRLEKSLLDTGVIQQGFFVQR